MKLAKIIRFAFSIGMVFLVSSGFALITDHAGIAYRFILYAFYTFALGTCGYLWSLLRHEN